MTPHDVEKERWLGDWHAVARKHNACKAAHSYMRHYEQLLRKQAPGMRALLEIGIGGGQSLEAWHELFPGAQVHGLDVTRHFDWDQYRHGRLYQLDQKDPALKHLFPPESLDVVVDDGLHLFEYQKAALENLWDALKPGGWYFIEDIIDPRDLHHWGTYRYFRLFTDFLRQSDRTTVSVDDLLIVIRKPPCPEPWEW